MLKAIPNGSALIPALCVTCQNVERAYLDDFGALICVDVLLRQSCAALKTIHIVDCELDTCAFLDRIRMPHLRQLFLSIHPSAEVLARFLKLSDQLEDVYLEEAQFDDRCAALLCASAENLRTLQLVFCQGLTDNGLVAIAKKAAELELFGLRLGAGVSEAIIATFAAQCPRLTSIMFSNTMSVATLIAIAEHCGPRLQRLALSNVQCNSDAGIGELTVRCTNIESLRWESTGVSMPALSRFIGAQTRLCELSLGGCQIDGSVLQSATVHGARLKYLGLYDTIGYSEADLMIAAQLCTALEEVSVQESSALIPAMARRWWQVLRPGLTFKHEFTLPPFWSTAHHPV